MQIDYLTRGEDGFAKLFAKSRIKPVTNENHGRLAVDAAELVLCRDERFVCETYIFEPTKQEEELGYLFAVGDVENRGGVGRELLDFTVTAIQKEYFRDSKRSVGQSFELALHQANLLLNDSAERGVKDWMGYFNVAVCVLTGSTLHVSVAGQASVSLVRKTTLTEVSEGLSVYPVTNPLRTFSQVASGALLPRDVLYVGSANFRPLFRGEDLKRFAIDHSAHTITTRLEQLYTDYGLRHPMSVLVVSLLPQYVVAPSQPGRQAGLGYPPHEPSQRRGDAIHQAQLMPRRPIVLKRSFLATAGVTAGKFAVYGWTRLKNRLWPVVKQGSLQLGGQARKGGTAFLEVSKRTVQGLAARQAGISIGRRPSWAGLKARVARLPASSKIFAVLAILFAIALTISLMLLRAKRAEDSRIQAASEQLHSARVAVEAAASALIYDNRDEAQKLLSEAISQLDTLQPSGLYKEEAQKLRGDIATQQDRLQKIARARGAAVHEIGSWSEFISSPANMHLFVIGDTLFTYDPKTNAMVKLGSDDKAERVTQTTEGIGFFVAGAEQAADKTIVLATDAPGVALFDSQDNSLLRQEITLPNEATRIGSLAVFGNRLYVFDQTTGQIHLYNKSLRGFTGGEAWIADGEFPKDTIRGIAIDGNIFTLHNDGAIRRLFKGVAADFTLEHLEPSLTSATRIITSEEHQYLYIVDPPNKRVVILTKQGTLVRQIFIEDATAMQDAAVPADEKNLYILDGARVLKVSLEQE